MAVISVPLKTAEALAELGSRQRRLSQRHRTVLLLVDGRRTERDVRQLATQAGSPASCFDELIDLGMIVVSRVTEPMPLDPLDPLEPSRPMPLSEPMPLSNGADSVVSSIMPASLSLQPDSSLSDLGSFNTQSPFDISAYEAQDNAMEEARGILLRAVRAEAPVAGSLTMLRLRRARTREDLESLLEEVEGRIFKPFKGLWASQTMARVRELLATQPPLTLPS